MRKAGHKLTPLTKVFLFLAKDTEGNFVVTELKCAESKYHVSGQNLNYMTWVKENLASEGERVRGIIVVGRADKTLRSAVRQVEDRVLLKEYRIKMTFTDVQ
jgi:RecB family endonuclease NucS